MQGVKLTPTTPRPPEKNTLKKTGLIRVKNFLKHFSIKFSKEAFLRNISLKKVKSARVCVQFKQIQKHLLIKK